MMKQKKYVWVWFLAPSFIGVLLFILIPFFDVIRRSFLTAVTGKFAGLSNYKLIFETPAFWLAVKNTFRFTITCIPILIALGLVTALLLTKIKQIQFIKSMLLFPMAVPAAAIVLIWKMIFYKQGFLNNFLFKVSEFLGFGWNFTGSIAPDYMGTKMAFWVLVISYIWKYLGYTVVLWLAGISSISTDIIEAAKVDGAGERKCLFRIILPNLKGTLYTITVLSFLNSFKVFREAYLVAGSYPDKSMYLLQHLFNNWYVNLDLDKMAAAAVLVGGVLFFFIVLLQRLWDEKEKI